MSGKNQKKKSGNLEVDDKWQPCRTIISITKSLVLNFLSALVYILSNAIIFFAEKKNVRNSCCAKVPHIFFVKKMAVFLCKICLNT